jgi:hypothetical protein
MIQNSIKNLNTDINAFSSPEVEETKYDKRVMELEKALSKEHLVKWWAHIP